MFGLSINSRARLGQRGERRRFAREPASLPAFIEVGAQAIPCTTANLSHGGAMLIFSSYQALPRSFTLHIPSQRFAGEARLAWQEDVRVGVEFLR